MTSEQLTAILLAAIAAPGFWDILKNLIDKMFNRRRVTIEEIGDKIDSQGKQIDRKSVV